jgi:hypothetical protein
MPIGTVDYVSTRPWNDPTNPWPQYSRLLLSASDVKLGSGVPFAYELSYFFPATIAGVFAWAYTSIDDTYDGAQSEIVLYKASGAGNAYEATVTYNAIDDLYQLAGGTRRSIPAGWKQGNTNWVALIGANVTSLSIMPVTTYLTPWEFRRRRLLEYV